MFLLVHVGKLRQLFSLFYNLSHNHDNMILSDLRMDNMYMCKLHKGLCVGHLAS
jgi:hypothetical protein